MADPLRVDLIDHAKPRTALASGVPVLVVPREGELVKARGSEYRVQQVRHTFRPGDVPRIAVFVEKV